MIIEKDIPIPADFKIRVNGKKSDSVSSLLGLLNVGESVVFPRRKIDQVYIVAKRLGIKICLRKIDGVSVRLWRVL